MDILEILAIIAGLAFGIFLLYIIWLLSYSMIRGAPYAALGQEKTTAMIKLLNIKAGEKALDLGAGDGRIVIALARAGAKAYGYEINPILVWIAKRNIKRAGLEGQAFVARKDYWHASIAEFDIVTLYGNFPIMNSLEKKLQKELPKHARVASNFFRFPHWRSDKKLDTVYLYLMKHNK